MYWKIEEMEMKKKQIKPDLDELLKKVELFMGIGYRKELEEAIQDKCMEYYHDGERDNENQRKD